MDTSTSCNSTSTSTPVKLDLRLLDQCSLSALTRLASELLSRGFGCFRLHTSLRLCALIRSWQAVYVCRCRCVERALYLKTSSGGAELRTLLHKNTFSGVRESGGDVFLT